MADLGILPTSGQPASAHAARPTTSSSAVPLRSFGYRSRGLLRENRKPLSFPKRTFRHRVEARRVLGEVLLPALGVPKLEMIADADKRDFVLQAAQLHESLGDQNPAGTVHLDRFCLSEIEPAENHGFR